MNPLSQLKGRLLEIKEKKKNKEIWFYQLS